VPSKDKEDKNKKEEKMKYTFQYSYPNDRKIAISDWIERAKIIEADNLKEAVKKGNKSCEHLGTWMCLDCYPIQ